MVATQFARGRAVAAAILAILVLAIVPATPVQAQGAGDISIVQGEAHWRQSNFFGGSVNTSFIDNGTATATLRIPVYNLGPAIDNVPVYYWIEGAPDRTDCRKISIGASQPGGALGMTVAEFDVPTRLLPPGAWNVSIMVYPASFSDTEVEADERCVDPVSEPLSTGGECTIPLTCRVEQSMTNNVATAYFVKERFLNLKVAGLRWCEGANDPEQTRCDADMVNDQGQPYNVTPYFTEDDEQHFPNDTFFEVVVRNDVTPEWAWANFTDYGGRCASTSGCPDEAGVGFFYTLNVSVRGAGIVGTEYLTTVVNTSANVDPETGTHGAWSASFSLDEKRGPYNVTVRLDPLKHLRRHDANEPVVPFFATPPVEVGYRDFMANFSAPGTTGAFAGASAATAYSYESFFEITGNITLRNVGPARTPTDSERTSMDYPDPAVFTIYLDNLSWTDPAGVVHENERFIKTFEWPYSDNHTSHVYELTWVGSSNLNSDNFLPPGRHTIYVLSDDGDLYLELNESNNNASFEIYVEDVTKPRFNGTPTISLERPDAPGSPTRTYYRPHEGVNFEANVLDDDNLVNVTVNFTLDSNQSVYRVVKATREPTDTHPERFVATVLDFKFHNFSTIPAGCGTCSENWTATIHAVDSFNNSATPHAIPFRLRAWPIHNATADYVIVAPEAYPAATHPWNSGPDPSWTIRVEANATGYLDPDDHQQLKTTNLAHNVTVQATGTTFNFNGTYWTPRTPLSPGSSADPQPLAACDPYPRSAGGIGSGVGQQLGGTPSACDETANNTFIAALPRDERGAAPGIWNYSIRVTDIAGYTRVINGTLDLEDFKPEINGWNLTGTTEVRPPGKVQVQANVSDDNNNVAGAFLNLTRTSVDAQYVNITLTKREESAETGETWYLYNETIDIKRGSPNAIGMGGTFNATLHVVDDVGNWNSTGLPGTFTIVDQEAPQLTGFGVIPPIVEIGENVTFWANASDATNVSIKIEIFRAVGSSELLMDPIVIPQPSGSGPWNYTRTLNFSTETVHSYRITAIDSAGTASTPGTGTITIRDNLGPKYDVVSPSVLLDGDRYGSATPRIEVVVRDVEGVQGASIEMTVAGLPVDFDLLPAPGNLNGYLVSYTVPATRKFSHRDLVEVSLNATDNSSEALRTSFNFSFVVDDVAPTARIVSITPSFRDQASHVLNVSLASRFTLAAEDADNLPTGIPTGGIRYRILGGGPGAETVYSGPFRINDAAGVYTGPRLYQIQFWAEDDVGNFNRQFNVTTVYVDDTPPALFQFFPQGRSINATFVDDRVGVNRSVVWYRLNDQAYTPLPLTEREGSWTLQLPEGVKGDRVSYYLQAWDRLDNTETFGNATSPYASFDVSNHEPTLRIVTPVDGGRVSRTIELRWDAADEDGDALVFTVYYRAPGRTNFVELAKLENTEARRYNIDTTRFPDGEYTFRVAAGDGGFVKLAETTVTVINSAGAIGAVSVTGDAVPGGTMLVTAEVTKAEATVSAHLYLDDILLEEYPMNDEGRDGDVTANDGIFTARVPVTSAGNYRVEIVTQYREDGVLKESSLSPTNAAFSAKLTPGYILSEYGAVIALIGLLAAVGIGVAVFVVMRRR